MNLNNSKKDKINKGLKMWEQAKKLIPGGNGLLSKRPERYAPDIWPAYFSKAKGVEVWDLDNIKYIDMAYMGVGTSILGYSDNDVDAAVKTAIDRGINTTLNAPEEVYLAKKLVELNPFAGSVKFTRTGGEAMAVTVRIARAYTGRDKVAFSGYHGWCDWYLAANLSGENKLEGHLLPGLFPKGVPAGLRGTALPFEYNNVEAFKELVSRHKDIGTIVIEGARYSLPSREFIQVIKSVAQENKMVVIFDEITSGWRITDGGVYKKIGFQPDIVVYGKAMGNGFAIAAIVGRHEVMDAAQDSFISSTFWTERVGFVAALATIKKLIQNKVWEHLIGVGTKIGEGWESLAKKYSIKLHVTDFKPLITMKFEYDKLNSAIATLFIQEMLKKGYLASTSVYVSYAHTNKIVEQYLKSVDEVFAIISEAINTDSVYQKLETKVKEEGFKRLT
ncbi:MAG: aminotransferase class III-fold pyridoxal phosphate-dependent enzyme [Omnitrophica bacterium]|nr:aminotransferase class III-fold pyridoxal phosphate-dependent enzyme [Candidatus Omnitrophota bacterium]